MLSGSGSDGSLGLRRVKERGGAVFVLSERAGRYLQIVGGELASNLLALIRPEFREELRAALSQALQHQTNVEAWRQSQWTRSSCGM